MASWVRLLVRVGIGFPVALMPLLSHATPTAAVGHAVVRGADVSWPNCPKGEGIPSRRSKGEPMPTRSARFVVVGLTNGPGFHPNPCLSDQVTWVDGRHLLLGGYAMTTFPTGRQIHRYGRTGPFRGADRHAALRNAGYAEATYNIQTMTRVGLHVPLIWVDVEPYPVAPWTHKISQNRAVITGVIRGYQDAGYQVGIYTYARGWRDVVGTWRLPYPTWATAGHGTTRQALHTCSRGPSGGPTWLAQWWRGPHRDLDLVCPAGPPAVGTIFSPS